MQEYNDRITRRAAARATSRFPVLQTLSTVAQVAGWILLVGGGVLFIIAVVGWLAALGGRQDGLGGAGTMFAFGAMVPSMVAMMIGFFSVLFGEMTKVFMGIEQNTFHMVEQRGDYERRLQQEGEGSV
jgi:hypothetical protein